VQTAYSLEIAENKLINGIISKERSKLMKLSHLASPLSVLLMGLSLSLVVHPKTANAWYVDDPNSYITVIGPSGTSYSKNASITVMSTNKLTIVNDDLVTLFWDVSLGREAEGPCGLYILGVIDTYLGITVSSGTSPSKVSTDGRSYIPVSRDSYCPTGTHYGRYFTNHYADTDPQYHGEFRSTVDYATRTWNVY
jgi:hypothetical protein